MLQSKYCKNKEQFSIFIDLPIAHAKKESLKNPTEVLHRKM